MKSKNVFHRFFLQAKVLFQKWQSSSNIGYQLDSLLAQAQHKTTYAECCQWLIELTHWIRKKERSLEDLEESLEEAQPTTTSNYGHLRYLFFVLDRHLEWKKESARILRTIMRECDGISFLCDAGMPTHSGFFGALIERFNHSIIPPAPNQKELSALATLMFPNESDVAWIQDIPDDLLIKINELFEFDLSENEEKQATPFSKDLLGALHNLVCQISSTGLSHTVRSRLPNEQSFESLPFYQLSRAMVNIEKYENIAHQLPLPEAFIHDINYLRVSLDSCHHKILGIMDHLYVHGVSIDIVFQVMRMKMRIKRAEQLLNAWITSHDLCAIRGLAATLINANQNSQSIQHLFKSNFALLSRRLVETNANTGEHYIARDRSDFFKMFKMALGGGMITVATVCIKLWIAGANIPALIEGLFAGANYAISFLIMHFLHFTLATKQPAMTAPTIAREIDQAHTEKGLESFVDSVMALFRTQVAAICGNVLAVFPLCLALQLGTHALFGMNIISAQYATKTLQSFSLLGPTPFWAALTGVILWSSSIMASWADNWFTLHRVGDAITYNRRLHFTLGEQNTINLAHFCRNNIAGVVGNIGLGMLLGLMPIFLKTLSFSFQIRHVTLSAGSIAIAIGILGSHVLYTSDFWWAIAGLLSMAFLNVAVSFLLGFIMAIRSRSLKLTKIKKLVLAIMRRMINHPSQLIWPKQE